jgi:protein Tex
MFSKLDPKQLELLSKEYADGRPLYSLFLERHRLNITVEPPQIREFYKEKAQQTLVESLKEKLKEDHDALLKEFPALASNIDASASLEELQSLERRLKRRHRSKAAHARQLGLEDSFLKIYGELQGQSSSDWENLIPALQKADNEELSSKENVLKLLGALLGEKLMEDVLLYKKLKDVFFNKALVKSTKSEKAAEDSKFKSFFEYQESIEKLFRKDHAHRFLNLRRGVSQGDINMTVEGPRGELESFLFEAVAPLKTRATIHSDLVDWALSVATDILDQYFVPQLQKEAFNSLRECAENEVLPPIQRNLRRVLMTPGLGRQVVMGISPSGKKTCRVAVVDREGHFKETALVHLLEDTKQAETEAVFLALIEKHQVQAIALSDHPGAREIERFLQNLFRSVKIRIPMSLLPAEATDDYASSKIAQEEFPDIETPNRKAIFVARQLQNPLGEYVKVKPKSLGVGQFLSEIHPESLAQTLETVLNDCIHEVGVDLNSASKTLLSKVSGLNEESAQQIINYRTEKGFFWDRDQVQDIEGLSPEAFEYAGPFLRIRDGKNPLDVSYVHPKHNKAVLDALKRQKIEKAEWTEKAELLLQDEKLKTQLGDALVQEIVDQIKNPPKDPRGEFKHVQFREDIKDIRDLKIGMICPGRVSNVTSFGAFVDIGIQQDGLVHLSELSNTFVRDPFDVIHPGDVVTIKVLTVNPDKKQISFTMKNLAEVAGKNQEIAKRQKDIAEKERSERAARPQSRRPEQRAADSRSPRKPSGDRRPSERPNDRAKGRSHEAPRGPRKPSSQQELRDNPFAALAGLKEQLKR